jgi:hypothetical protein
MKAGQIPIITCHSNLIGLLTKPSGAIRLFQSLRHAVQPYGGVAIISAYLRDAISTHVLNIYESIIEICGQPSWLVPETYANPKFRQVAQKSKTAYDMNPLIMVDVYSADGALVKRNHELRRDEDRIDELIKSGEIHTCYGYKSSIYSYDEVSHLIEKHWPVEKSHHYFGDMLDDSRAEFLQIAILDGSGKL